MNSETHSFSLLHDHKDSFLYMLMRREINQSYAEHVVDFNYEGIKAAEIVAGRSFNANDIIVDVGSSVGSMAAQAAVKTGTKARVVCIEPDIDAGEAYNRLPLSERTRVSYMHAVGETLPIRDSSVQSVTMHNVIFRSSNAGRMLAEAKRIVEPGGSIMLSSNAEGHAYKRHLFEQAVALRVMQSSGVTFEVPAPPAEGYYLESIPELVASQGGIRILDNLYVTQASRAIITPGLRMEDYLQSIKYSAANIPNLPENLRAVWRKEVDAVVEPSIWADIMASSESNYTDSLRDAIGPYFADPIMRGMFVLQVE